MARLSRYSFLAIAVIFHLIYMMSIFDIYFVSPIVHGMRSFRSSPPDLPPPSKRLMLFVGDGLRADKAFQRLPDPNPAPGTPSAEAAVPRHLAPFLRSKVFEGTFGVSHTRVPTESRPGHVALIAGLYEDVSAVTTGWKLNPVNFDSVFNRSTHTWSWGSPDILPMFKEGAVEDRIDAYTYAAEAEDFSKDATHLDTWVFEHVEHFFERAKRNEGGLGDQIRKGGIVFFLHLLGLDTTGHAYRPYSREYLANIKLVDEGVRRITEIVDKFYADDQTSYVFTADHGMSDWGSHGDGHPDNTRTPLIAWGAGVAKQQLSPEGTKAAGHEDGFSSDWDLDRVPRHDVAQADVAALMTYLAGLDYPVNSVGELPLPFLDAAPKEKAYAALANARGIIEQYHVKEKTKQATEIRYQGYPGLSGEVKGVEHRVEAIEAMIAAGNYAGAIQDSQDLLQLGLQGMRYLQTYDWLFLRTVVTLGYLGWAAYALISVIDQHVLNSATTPERSPVGLALFGAVLTGIYAILFAKSSPVTYYAYVISPVAFWEEVWAKRAAVTQGGKILLKDIHCWSDYITLVVQAIGALALLQALARGYHDREIFSICFMLACSWPAYYGKLFARRNLRIVLLWVGSCVVMSFFTFLPAIKKENTNLILMGGTMIAAVGVLYLLYEQQLTRTTKLGAQPSEKPIKSTAKEVISGSRLVIGLQTGLILLAMFVTRSSALSLQAKKGLPLGNQIIGWSTLIFSFLLPMSHILFPRPHYITRLTIIFLTLGPSFTILTISYEALFYFAFGLNLFAWIKMEAAVYRFQAAVARGQALVARSAEHSTGPSTPAKSTRSKTGRTANGHASPASSSPAQNGSAKKKKPDQPLEDLTSATASLSLSTVPPSPATLLHSPLNPLTLSHLRTSLFFLTLLQSAFFSTGNLATISSFSLDSVYRLLPIFDPFSQGALLVLKLLIPFALLSAALGVLNRILGLGRGALVGVSMGVSEVLTLVFFYGVRDEGSWLEIGTGISHFIIAGVLGIFCAGLEALGGLVVGGLDVSGEMGDGTEIVMPEELERGGEETVLEGKEIGGSFREEIRRGVEALVEARRRENWKS